MKMVIAILRPSRSNEVKEALEEMGVKGLTITEVRGHGRQKGHKEVFRGKEYQVDLLPKTRIEIAVADSQVDQVIETIMASARTGETGDGKIMVVPIENVFRIRTGESGIDAI
ncbi:MAG: P-II family nitrogen regulator [Candidatus Omnitrophica bacterium]|nr:P-II family nitrogen regulator [Candidatus Omnitrophota bacterium]MCA9414791.1 P-II family nitrogen regulator [Candidatus Omnitrophota bacterium]MCA9424902.1 P-II family nitrogen regulator [Candidatus Omnitrophota bacterium]MCA9432813.1 P-II family nitrogen regulator [Candidatus Omnitrophota bacterium]MCA9434135.1 P-II family nitrogen regulator [Candidatus Omnitrophota bacterium]